MDIQIIYTKIHNIRGQRVMLDYDLAELYEVETRTLKQAVRRNIERFPDDFMFELSQDEFYNLTSQNVMSSWGGLRHPPFAFTEHGVAMLSGVLRSATAILVNIAIFRAFVALRHHALNYQELAQRIAELEKRLGHELADIRETLGRLANENESRMGEIDALDTALDALFDRLPNENPLSIEPRTPIGFKRD